jgi:hypothetical protein
MENKFENDGLKRLQIWVIFGKEDFVIQYHLVQSQEKGE